MPTFTKLKGISDISESTLCDQLEANLIEFFNWGLLGIGAFFNVSVDLPEAKLRPVEVTGTSYIEGQLWEPFRNDIIWESGVEYGLQPVGVSGIYVDGNFYPSNTTGTYKHYLDYYRGRIVFDNPIPLDSEVKLEYSYRYFHFTTADVPWFRQVMFESFRVDDSKFLQYGSGVWSVLAQNRVQLPAVVVETVPRRTFQGYQLGGGQKVKQDVLFHIFTENPWDRKTILDIISYQNQKTISSYDKNLIAKSDRFAFDEKGALASGAMTYPQLIAPTSDGGFFWKKITFDAVTSQETISLPPLYQAVIRGTFEVILPEI
jgi:hypothetical protein